MTDPIFFRRLRDDEGFDEIRLVSEVGDAFRLITRYRYKTSGLSGDEWRTSTMWQIMNREWKEFNGPFLDLRTACAAMYPGIYTDHPDLHGVEILRFDFYRKGHLLYRSTYDGKALPLLPALGHLPWALIAAREIPGIGPGPGNDYCFQPGCAEKAISIYQLKKEYSRGGISREPIFRLRRAFCRKHLRRGDCGLEDADDNYIVVSGPGPDEAAGFEADVSRSAFGGVVTIPNADQT